MAEPVRRTPALDGRRVERAGITIVPAGSASRISLRGPAASLAALSKALGLALPERPKSSAAKGARAALWLGPDEWLVLDEENADLMGACARAGVLHSAVDISHRNTAIIISGPRAEDVLSAGCPQDLAPAAFPVGAASRTVFGKVEVVLWRTEASTFRMEVWRSFSDYAFTLLEAAARDPG
jgi:sarcosine oxidase subunit gamma